MGRYTAKRWLGEAGRVLQVALAAALAMSSSACSVGLSSDDRVEATGSIGRGENSPLSRDLGQEDWRRAKGALAIALDPQGSGAEVKWDNPDSGAGGTVTPVGQPFVRQPEICRSFIAAINFPGRSTAVQGTACKLSGDEWQVREVSPWRKPAA